MRPPYRINCDPVAGDAPPFPAPRELDSGDESFLVPLADSHFDPLFIASHGDARRESVWDFLPYGPFASPTQMRACYRALPQNGDPQFYAVMRRDSDLPIPTPTGVMSYLRIQPAARSIEIGHIWHAVARQKTRANTIGNFLLMDAAFASGNRRVEWKCDAANAPSRAAALRLGFAFEGVFRRCMVTKNRNRDIAWFALIDSDWPQARANIEEWLAGKSPSLTDVPSLTDAPSLTAANRPLVEWSLAAHESWPLPRG